MNYWSIKVEKISIKNIKIILVKNGKIQKEQSKMLNFDFFDSFHEKTMDSETLQDYNTRKKIFLTR